ncbi:MAG: nucleoside-diphosphate kinase [Saccharospirillaceae bacterium]|nr:nucleoside-diphosphate kinase [Pseudomonadales bacterium]NRB77868.1 nucleoside-diphosphate kinase [Saccharospirillaceae bacterium]
MELERTLSIIKPNAVKENHIGEIITLFEQNDLKVKQLRMIKLDKHIATQFYNEHIGKGFFQELLDFMLSGEVVVLMLEGEGAIARYRTLMGATNPNNADEGTLRALFGSKSDLTQNAVHGSDCVASAKRELGLFF